MVLESHLYAEFSTERTASSFNNSSNTKKKIKQFFKHFV